MPPRFLLPLMVIAALVIGVPPALGCSPRVDTLTDETTGVYQQETISVAPSVGFREAKSASMVVRYWGQPPSSMGIEYGGGDWFSFLYSSSCGSWSDRVGAVRYGTPEYDLDDRRSPRLFFEDDGATRSPNDADLARIEERFGPPVVVAVDAANVVRATIGVWFTTLASLVTIFGTTTIAITARWRRSRGRFTTVDSDPSA